MRQKQEELLERQLASQEAMAARSEAKRVEQEARVAKQEAEQKAALAKQAVEMQKRQEQFLERVAAAERLVKQNVEEKKAREAQMLERKKARQRLVMQVRLCRDCAETVLRLCWLLQEVMRMKNAALLKSEAKQQRIQDEHELRRLRNIVKAERSAAKMDMKLDEVRVVTFSFLCNYSRNTGL
eukprot:SAG31_NODE_2099_length_6447_cov_8.302615_3_plen_183_part_00